MITEQNYLELAKDCANRIKRKNKKILVLKERIKTIDHELSELMKMLKSQRKIFDDYTTTETNAFVKIENEILQFNKKCCS